MIQVSPYQGPVRDERVWGDPVIPDGPDWWRHKGGWDKIASAYWVMFQGLVRLRKKRHQWLEKDRRDIAVALHAIRRQQTRERALKRRLNQIEKEMAGYVVKLREAELAIARGQLALSPEEWKRLVEQWKERERRFGLKPRKPRQPCRIEGCKRKAFTKGVCSIHLREAYYQRKYGNDNVPSLPTH